MEPRVARPIMSQVGAVRRMVGLIPLEFPARRERKMFERITGGIKVSSLQLCAVERIVFAHMGKQVGQPATLEPPQVFGRQGLFIHDVV